MSVAGASISNPPATGMIYVPAGTTAAAVTSAIAAAPANSVFYLDPNLNIGGITISQNVTLWSPRVPTLRSGGTIELPKIATIAISSTSSALDNVLIQGIDCTGVTITATTNAIRGITFRDCQLAGVGGTRSNVVFAGSQLCDFTTFDHCNFNMTEAASATPIVQITNTNQVNQTWFNICEFRLAGTGTLAPFFDLETQSQFFPLMNNPVFINDVALTSSAVFFLNDYIELFAVIRGAESEFGTATDIINLLEANQTRTNHVYIDWNSETSPLTGATTYNLMNITTTTHPPTNPSYAIFSGFENDSVASEVIGNVITGVPFDINIKKSATEGYSVNTPAVGATTVSVPNPNLRTVEIEVLTIGTVTTACTITDLRGGTQVTTTPLVIGQRFILRPGEGISFTYTGTTPTWKWRGI